MEFKKELAAFLKQFEPYSQLYLNKREKEVKKYGELISNLYADLADFSSGGKRVRAFLVYLGYLLGKSGDTGKIFPICLAVEIFHSFLLIHDDIIDRSLVRRAKKTIHNRYQEKVDYHYGVSQAIVLGDVACLEATQLITASDFDDSRKIKCVRMVNDVLLETAYGEALDVEYGNFSAKLADVYKISDLKTARYTFVGPMLIGALMGGAKSSTFDAIRNFGLKIGLVFQMKDDLLGIFGDESVLGKSVLSDMREGKNTILIHKTREFASKPQSKIIDQIWGNQSAGMEELMQIQEIIKNSGSLDWYKKEITDLTNEGILYIPNITNDLRLSRVMQQMALYIAERDK